MRPTLNNDISVKVNSEFSALHIGELAELTGASSRSLRYYEEQGLIEASRASNGYRQYGHEAVAVVAQVRLLIAAGLDTKTIRALLPCTRGEQPEVELCDEVNAILLAEVQRLDDQISRINGQREQLLKLINS
ncbi:MerR family transcriptional regulator [Arthrobacter sp. TMN-49]